MPLTGHPLAGGECDQGQSGSVWFLGGSFSDAEVERNCSIPAGKAVFFPVLNTECSTIEPPPFYGETEEELADCAKEWVDIAVGACVIDGVPVQNMEKYRVRSPLFTVGPMPPDNVWGVQEGATGQSVSDGYWLMLAPLSVGQHTIEIFGTFTGVFSFHIKYNLTVAPGRK